MSPRESAVTVGSAAVSCIVALADSMPSIPPGPLAVTSHTLAARVEEVGVLVTPPLDPPSTPSQANALCQRASHCRALAGSLASALAKAQARFDAVQSWCEAAAAQVHQACRLCPGVVAPGPTPRTTRMAWAHSAAEALQEQAGPALAAAGARKALAEVLQGISASKVCLPATARQLRRCAQQQGQLLLHAAGCEAAVRAAPSVARVVG